ncbi:hypothetical protein BDP27DRAFT_1420991 [Rhodocollybia butyracea]|uniref:DUF6570 domain-containing protein n=1 Tax=Rhodocollybia butyracea TaxID=206335 RepID=A0A9P5PAR2_9AGAR|nr:hypothetical protein BDP27DRAFT_1430566 [Rhodocollybia butyracea]KAF9069536.1 hypothetical protein BDP27DRAFT_1420991 [Rhodocollybia butyracea]
MKEDTSFCDSKIVTTFFGRTAGTHICVIFVGSQPPTKEWMQKYAKPLSVRPGRVKAALEWLLTHNPLYIQPPVHIEHVPVGSIDESLISGYDPLALSSEVPESSHNFTPEISFDSVTIADVDPNASPANLQAAAVRHFENRKSYVELYHDPKPVNEFAHPQLFPMIYPTLFPYGIGGFEHPDCSAALSMNDKLSIF